MKNLKAVEAIYKVMQLYIEGTKTGNSKLLRSLFHEKAIMSGNLVGNKLVGDSPEMFFNDVDGKTAEKEYTARVINVDEQGVVGCATLIETNLMGKDFVNFYHLQNIEGTWKIVSKLFTSVD
ncbi:nuclear transport factor 2 family protein [Clostridiaceae bacterium M8S5]|nr:nuclear transport factor 2 family protein [Clostridiaceae bacterium M8S5]